MSVANRLRCIGYGAAFVAANLLLVLGQAPAWFVVVLLAGDLAVICAGAIDIRPGRHARRGETRA